MPFRQLRKGKRSALRRDSQGKHIENGRFPVASRALPPKARSEMSRMGTEMIRPQAALHLELLFTFRVFWTG